MKRKNNINSVIIGGTRGIGLAIALSLKKKGYEVVVGGRSKPNVEGDLRYKYIDVSQEETIKNFFSTLDLKQIDSIVYSAGITTKKKSIEKFNQDKYKEIHDVNLLGAILILKHAFQMLKKAKGRVVIINSIAARTYSKFSGIEYTVTKSGLSGLVRQLAIEWSKNGILINSIFPSMVGTDLLFDNLSKEELDKIKGTIPLGRIAITEELTSAIEFLISDKNTYITGSGIDINGGQYLSS